MMKRLRQRALAVTLAVALLALLPKTAVSADSLAWIAPDKVRVITWRQQDASESVAATAREPNARYPVELGSQELLLIPVEPGERIAVRGALGGFGLGSGVGDAPDVITWMPLPPVVAGVRELFVPAWSSARFVVLRAAVPSDGSKQALVVMVAARQSAPLAWYRLDEDVAAWLRGEQAAPSKVPLEAVALLRWLDSARQALLVPEATVLSPTAAAWLTSRYVEESFHIRPLREPYFVRRQVDVQGGRETQQLTEITDASPWRVIKAQDGSAVRLTLRSAGADVVRMAFQARSLGPTRAIVRVANSMVRELVWNPPSRNADRDRWTPPQWIHIVLPVEARYATVDVIQGEVAVAVVGAQQRVGIADFFSTRRDRDALLAQAMQPGTGESEAPKLLAAVARTHAAAAVKAALDFGEHSRATGSVRALVLAESIRWSTSSAEASARAAKAYAVVERDAPSIAAPLQRAILERLAAVEADAPVSGGPWSGRAWIGALLPDADPDDVAVLNALSEVLTPREDGRRPSASSPAEVFARMHGDIADAAARARQVWKREAAWDALEVPEGTRVWSSITTPTDVDQPDAVAGMCDVVGPQGLRWTLLDKTSTTVVVDAPQGAYARVLFRGASETPEPESTIRVDGIDVGVHAGAGVTSAAAIGAGLRTFERTPLASGSDSLPPVLARIPRSGKAACTSLREVFPWAWVEREVTFVIPDRERETVARIVVHLATPEGIQAPVRPSERMIQVRVGDVIYQAWIRPGATGAIEVPVPSGVNELRVMTSTPTLLRASARLRPAPPTPPTATYIKGLTSAVPVDVLLEAIRTLSHRLRGVVGDERRGLRNERATALELLGFRGLAALDREPDTMLDPDVATQKADTFTLPKTSPAVVPLPYLARIPPLPLPQDIEPLRAARAARLAGDAQRGVDALIREAAQSSDADALLLGLLAEQVSSFRTASDAFARIGLAHRSGTALARAANFATDDAAAFPDRLRTLRAFVLAQLAEQLGEPAPGALARLAPAIGWFSPPRSDRTAGFAMLELQAKADRDLPLPIRVRRALLDAPEEALLMTEGMHAEFQLDRADKTDVTLGTVCQFLDHEQRPCSLEVFLDGKPTLCTALTAAGGNRCDVTVPRGKHRLEVRQPQDQTTMAWVRAEAGGVILRGRLVAAWHDIDTERPLELVFAGPTVLRIRARTAYECASRPAAQTRPETEWEQCRAEGMPATGPTQLRYAVFAGPDDLRDPSETGALQLDMSQDLLGRRMGVQPERFMSLGKEAEARIAVLEEGPHLLRISAPQGRALIRVEMAVVTGVPRSREVPPPPPPSPPAKLVDQPVDLSPRVGSDPEEGPLLAMLYARYVDGDLLDEDPVGPRRYLEVGGGIYREVIENSAWLGVTSFGRLRTGPPSFGTEVWFDTADEGLRPALLLHGRAVVQQHPAGVRLGGRTSAEVFIRLPAGDVTVVPYANLTLLFVNADLQGQPDVDRDVFTPYSALHTTQGTLGARVQLRPAVDALLSLGTSLRLSPLLTTLDRIDLRADMDVLAGRGLFPWLQLAWINSVRPGNETRKTPYLREAIAGSVTFWNWFFRTSRISLAGEVTSFLDIPKFDQPFPRFSASVLARYDWVGGRGLRDLPPRTLAFRDRLEEGSGRIERQQPAVEPSWDQE